ncbi:MAG: hypothetical protein M1832_003040 [Thelocarpon impressellum]|nr:MAG: hypothetical protein M1832_003040 [Thelocarpon impressellum]
MADEAPPAEEQPVTFNVKSSSDAKYVLTLPASATVLELKNKLAGPDYADLPADRQRLIYSGRVLKDPDTLGSHKIKDGHTVHLVRSASSNQRQNPANMGTGAATAAGAPGAGAGAGATGVPSNLAAGTGNNPLAGLTGARYAGLAQLPGAGMFGPDGGMGAPPDPEQMVNMLSNPQFASTINEALQNPQVLDMMIQQNPMLRNVPGAREMMQSPEFRRMMTDPDTIRSMGQMGRAMGMGGMGGAGAGGPGSFPAPGVTDTTPGAGEATNTQTPGQTDTTGTAPPNPFAMFANPGAPGAANPLAALLAGAGGLPGANPPGSPPPAGQGAANSDGQNPPANPLAGLFNPAAMFPPGGAGAGDPNTQQNPQANPFANSPLLQNPQAMQQMLSLLTGGAPAGSPGAANPFAPMGDANPLGMFGGTGAAPPPADTRPPEERYAEQLRQLNDMGFYEFERNVEALRRSGGSVQGAVEYLLTH